MGSGRRSTKLWVPAPDRDPWDRQPKETDQAWAAFVVYRDMGLQRTLWRAAEILGKPKPERVLEELSARLGWRFRVESWDRHQDAMRRDAQLKAEAKDAAKQRLLQLDVADSMVGLAMAGLRQWAEYIARERAAGREPDLSPSDVQKLADAGMKLGRLVRDQPTAIEEQRVEMTVDDRRQRMQLAAKDPDVRQAMKVITERVPAKAKVPA